MTAQIKGFRTRADLKMRAPKSVSRNINASLGGVAVHYGGSEPNPAPSQHADCENTWRAWQNYHMDHNGWVDIAYTAGYCNHGYVLAGRGYGVRTAANGTNDANYKYLAFVWVGGGSATPSELAFDALDWLINDARKNGGAGPLVKPHKFFYPTSCPGTILTAKAATRDNKPVPLPTGVIVIPVSVGPKPTTTPQVPFPLPTKPRLHWYGRNDGTAYSHSGVSGYDRPNILKIQRALLAKGFDPHGTDGYFGDKTAAAVVLYQRSRRLLADGKVGPNTWNDLI
jgi:hypothetical protein